MKCKNVFCVFNENCVCLKKEINIGVSGNCEDIFLPKLPSNMLSETKRHYRNPSKNVYDRLARREKVKYLALRDFKSNIDNYIESTPPYNKYL